MALNDTTMRDAAIDQHEPEAHGDPMGTPADDERVLWKGKPDHAVLARTAFHTRTVGLYFIGLVALSVYLGNPTTAIVCAALGVLAVAILHAIAWFSARTTLYILTDTRLIMRIGMAIETRINVPLKHVKSADLKKRGKDRGDITIKLGGERLLGYVLLWPHVRPWHINHPQPMLRAVPDVQSVAEKLADACEAVVPIARAEDSAPRASEASGAKPVAIDKPTRKPVLAQASNPAEGELKGAPA